MVRPASHPASKGPRWVFPRSGPRRTMNKIPFHRLSFTSVPVTTALNRPPNRANPTVCSGGLLTPARDFHRLPTGAWANEEPRARGQPVEIASRPMQHRPHPAKRTRAPQRPHHPDPGDTAVANSCEEPVTLMARQVRPACHEPDSPSGPLKAAGEMRRGVRGSHQGPGNRSSRQTGRIQVCN